MEKTYGIKQFEKVTGVSAHTLRYFDKIGLLSPIRGENDYRLYSLEQVSIAETIVLLQRAMFSNAEIKEIIEDYNSDATIQRLKENRVKLRKEQMKLRRVLGALNGHIDYLGELKVVRSRLYIPFVEQREATTLGVIRLRSNDIVDFFDAGDVIMKDPAWPHFKKHGFLVPREKITPAGYPLESMFVDDARVAKLHPVTLEAGNYLCMYSDGSLENNVRAHELVQKALAEGYQPGDRIVIQQVSGPVVEKHKRDFLVKILVPIAGTLP